MFTDNSGIYAGKFSLDAENLKFFAKYSNQAWEEA